MTVTAWETFDLVGEATRSQRRSTFHVAQSPGGTAPSFSRLIDERPIRRWLVVIERARRIELRRLTDLWNRTRFGQMPMTWTHPTEGQVFVVFDMDELEWMQTGARVSRLEVPLREWLG